MLDLSRIVTRNDQELLNDCRQLAGEIRALEDAGQGLSPKARQCQISLLLYCDELGGRPSMKSLVACGLDALERRLSTEAAQRRLVQNAA